MDPVVEQKLEVILQMLAALTESMEKLAKRVEDLGQSCCSGFIQTREACHILRQDLSEAAGTMVEESWN